MVVYNKETKLGNWIDWEGASTSYTIKRLSDSKLQIDFTGLKDSYNMITRSIGGLNVYTVHYSFYHSKLILKDTLQERKEEIQCVISAVPVDGWEHIGFGKSQRPHLNQYADGVDTMDFLTSL